MHLHRERGTFGAVVVVETFDQCELPQRPRSIEPRRRHRLKHVEQRPFGAGRREPHSAQMKIEIEGRFDRPTGWADTKRW